MTDDDFLAGSLRKGMGVMENRKPKIYGLIWNGQPGWYLAAALTEDGQCLATHVSSNESFAKHDLGMNGQDWSGKHEYYKKHYPDGYEVEFVPQEHAKGHVELQAAIAANDAMREKEATKERTP